MKNTIAVPAITFCIFILFAAGCKSDPKTLFQLLPSTETGITFSNTIVETDSFNILTYEYIYNGGGVSISDFNNDGLQDVFFSGNQIGNTLYLNKGDFHFEDITSRAGVNVPGRWNSGVAVADINSDGWMDIYVCATMNPDSSKRKNMLFINNGLNPDGIPTFSEKAESYGVADYGHSTSAAFFDYDRDGDLELYVLTNEKLKNFPTNFRAKMADGSSPNNDRLYRNNGDGTFANVTIEAGITMEGFGLGLSVANFNLDGWPDLYVSNDYLSNDILYMNNKNGTFTNRTTEFIGHQSQFSMGNDAADINNDGKPDIITLDMLPEINRRKKTTIGNKSYQNYINNEKFGYEYQYVRNMLHLNNGLDQGIKFSEIGELSGIYQTEWSWSPLFADFDNDGDKDLLVTNGFPKDITDKDFANFRADVGNVAGIRYLVDSIPVVKIANYGYKNNGDLTFTDVTLPWGLQTPSFSNGATFADLDNDGDLDYVVNNINDMAFVYKNTLYEDPQKKEGDHPNFLRIRLQSGSKNRQGIGANVTLRYGGGKIQYSEQSIYRGFLSSVEPFIHFGLGAITTVDSVLVKWPDGNVDLLRNVKSNQVLIVEEKEGKSIPADSIFSEKHSKRLFRNVTQKVKVAYRNKEEDTTDYNIQRTLPHKFSQSGPGICVGDINNDGLEDFLLGGSAGNGTTVYVQKPDGTFLREDWRINNDKKTEEDEGLLLFDVDNDNDLDLYIVSGSVESGPSPRAYEDRLYINDGKGQFTLDKGALPETGAIGSCVRAADYNQDGDLDLFVAGRVVTASDTYPAESYVLRNDHGKFTNVTSQVCPDLKTPGMVTDAVWSDFNQDGKVDLILVGEFMPVTFFRNEGAIFSKLKTTGTDSLRGWWNSITSGDYDHDGDIDYIIGNLGLNNYYQATQAYPLRIYAKDFDGNGSVDPVLACYQRESLDADVKKLYPVHFYDELNSQSPKFRKRFENYKKYGMATVDQVLTQDEIEGALVMEANDMTSSYLENLGNGKFAMRALPTLVQVAPVNGMVTDDFNEDGNTDVLLVGNDYGNEVFAGRYDAFTGLVLAGDGKGSFNVIPSAHSGFYVGGDAKGLSRLSGAKGDLFIATQNRDRIKVFSKAKQDNRLEIRQGPLEYKADLLYNDGRKERIEFYYGSGYLSQSTRRVRIPKGVKEIILSDYKGRTRKITPLR